MNILLTNDDGIHAHGLRALYYALREAGHRVRVAAPMTEQSAVGHAITVINPLRVKEVKEENFSGFGIFGTPADCVKLAVGNLLDERPDMVVSGINAGANVGADIMYSGTVAAAREAASLGFPAMAVSYDAFRSTDLTEEARYAVQVLGNIPWDRIPERRVMNLNMPAIPLAEYKGLSLCPQTAAAWNDWYNERKDPRGVPYWWLEGEIPADKVAPGTDRARLSEGWATLTPLLFDFTDHETLDALGTMAELTAPFGR